MSFTFASTTRTVAGTISSFTNPFSTRSISGSTGYYSSCGATANAAKTSTFTFSTGTVSTVSLATSSDLIGDTGCTLTVTFQPGTVMKPSGQIDLIVPEYYSTSDGSSTESVLDTTSVVTSSSVTITSYTFAPSTRTMTIQYSSSSSISSSTSVTFSVTQFKNPIDSSSKSGFYVNTNDDSGYQIDQSSSSFSLTAISTPSTLESISVELYDSTSTLDYSIAQTGRTLKLSFSLGLPIEQYCYLKITFPDEVKIDVDETLNTYVGSGILSGNDVDGTISSSDVSKYGYTDGNYIILPGCTDTDYLGADQQGTIELSYVVSPCQLKDTDDFTLELYKDLGMSISIATGTVNIYSSLMTGGSISSMTFTAVSSDTVQTETDFEISFNLVNNLYYDSRIIITVPTKITTLTTSCEVTVKTTNLDGDADCSISGTTFIIDNPFESNSLDTWDYDVDADDATITLTIEGGYNPTSVSSAGTWSVVSYNLISGTYYQVDSGTSSTSYTPTVGTLTASGDGITTTSLVTYASSGTYVFYVSVSHSIPSSGYIQITLSSDMSVASSSSVTSSCNYYQTSTSAYAKQTCSVSGSAIKMTLSAEHSSDDVLQMKFTGIRNPRTFEPSSSLTIGTYDSSGNVIDQGTGFSVTMTTMGTLTSMTVSMDNTTNGAIANYTFKITTSIPLYAGDILYITFPDDIVLPTDGSLYCEEGTKISAMDCSNSGQNLVATLTTLTSTSGVTGTITFTVVNATNPPSTYTSDSFSSIYLTDSSGYKIAQLSSSTDVTVTTDTAANILTYSLYQDKYDLNTVATYRISFTPTNAISSTGSIILYWPSQVSIYSNVSCSITTTQKYTDLCTITAGKRKIFIKEAFANSATDYVDNIDIELYPVTNPKDNRNLNGFIIYTYDDAKQKYAIDVLNDYILLPQTLCNFPCNTCMSSNKDYCLSCWTDLGYPYLQYLSSSKTQTCGSTCSNGYTSNGDSNKICTACDLSCATCIDQSKSGDKYKCKTCSEAYKYKYGTYTCLTECGFGQYESATNVCSDCSSPCQQCTNTASYCTDCFASSTQPYLYSNTCVATCPAGYTSINRQCQQCDSTCKTCSDSLTRCTSCNTQSSLKYKFGYSCYSVCPAGTQINDVTYTCDGCLTGCVKCDSKDQTICLQCTSSLLLFEGTCVATCPSGYITNFLGTACEKSDLADLPLVYFPHLTACFVMGIVVIGGYIKDKRSLVVSNMIIFIGMIEFVSYFAQTAIALLSSTYLYVGVSAFALITYITMNITFVVLFNKKIGKVDEGFLSWKQDNPYASRIIAGLSCVLSFKMIRLYFSFLYGHDNFKAPFTDYSLFEKYLKIFSIAHMVASNLIIIGIDVIGILATSWGTQLYIIMIETAILSLLLMILFFIEFKNLRSNMSANTQMYRFVNSDSVMNASSMDNELVDKKMREDMLRQIMKQVKGNKDLFLNNKLDQLLQQFGARRCKSMIGLDNEKEEDPRNVQTWPNSPRSFDDGDFQDGLLNFRNQFDNVYADAKPRNPVGTMGKNFTDADSQVATHDLDKIMSRKGGEYVNYDATESQRKRDKKNKKRGRKNQYYAQIDAEDDEEAENMDADDRMETDNLDIIKEEDEEEQMKKKMQKKKEEERLEKEKQEQEKKKKEELEKEMKKIEDERAKKEQKDLAKKLKEEQEVKKLEDEIAQQKQNDPMFEEQKAVGEGSAAPQVRNQNFFQQQNSMKKSQESLMNKSVNQDNNGGTVTVPPDAQKRNFNENDILGNLDRDEKGNIIVLQDENGNTVDKDGTRVNERGYLVDPDTGDIIENTQNQKMFNSNDIDERGDIPAPFCVEKYNFNPFNIRGEFDNDKQGRPIINKNKNGELVDKKGRRVNKRGWLIDNNGNIIDKFGRKKFDKRQLTPEGDLPKLFNYNGRRFDIMDVCGVFDRDPAGNIIFKQNKQGQLVDNIGRPVNEKGYLIDANGNIIDKDKKKIFEKRFLKNGEFPKIFPFTKFNIKNVQGIFEMDPLGNPILDKNSNGEFIDRDGKRVNQRGYFIDENGNVIDKNGKLMFDKIILDQEGEIPKVFRTGLLKSDSGSSLSRLMSEIEKNQPSDYENENRRVQNELNRLQQHKQKQQQQKRTKRGDKKDGEGKISGNTSVDSLMEDTPSNYNIANQRFDVNKHKRGPPKEFVQEEDSQYEGEMGDGSRRRKKGRKKRRQPEYREPSDKDLRLAKVYGGEAKGAPIRGQKGMARNLGTAESSRHSKHGGLNRVAGSVAGFQKGQQSREQLEEIKRDGNQTHISNFLNETNDPSFMAVPEHHIREARLKQRKMNELKRKKQAQKQKHLVDTDFEKMFGKDIDEFLEDSDWDLESLGNMSRFSKGTARSAFNDGRIRGLESIYLQRIETSMKKGGMNDKNRTQTRKAKFRAMQDRILDPQYDPDIHADKQGDSSLRSPGNVSKKKMMIDGSMHSLSQMGDDRRELHVLPRSKLQWNPVPYRRGPEYKHDFKP